MAPVNRREFLKSAGAVSLGTALGASVGISKQVAAAEPPSAGKAASDVLSLPKGGGAIQGIGETFKADPFTGSASFSVPIATSPGRSGFGPQLSLSYSSGSGNGPFGLGWGLSVPHITRKTEKGLPQYKDRPEDRKSEEQKDTFVLSGVEDLVEHVGRPQFVRGDFKVTTYHPRVEGLFAKIEKWERESGIASTGLQDVFWRVITRDNITNYYGRTPQATIADVETGQKVFAWLLELTFDSKGNYIRYEYKAEDLSGIENDPYEASRGQNQKYLKRIRYGNFTPFFPESEGSVEKLLTAPPSDKDAFFLALFDYGEHGAIDPDGTATITADIHLETKKWEPRSDPFGTFRAGAGIELRTQRRCKRVLMIHTAIPGEQNPVLVKSTDFRYSNAPLTLVSRLVSVTQRGYAKARTHGPFESEDIALGFEGVRSEVFHIKSMPPVEFGYSEFVPGKQRRIPIESVDGDAPPSNLGSPNVALVDLFGTGLQDVVQTTSAGYYFWRNRGGTFDRRNVLREQPAGVVLGQRGVGFGDMNGNGQADLMVHSGPTKGYWEATNEGGWKRFHPYRTFPTFEPDDPNVRMVDLTGDGTADALRTEADSFVFIPCLGEDGFDKPRRIARQHNLEEFPDVYFNDATGRVRMADMNGDGLKEICLVYSGTCAWYPNLGYGNFGKRVLMNNAPNFGANFDPLRVLLLDIDGDGTEDLCLIESGRVRYWLNQAGKCWSEEQVIDGTPKISNYTSVQVADMLGNGTNGILWSGDFRGNDGTHYVFLDLAGGRKPNLLTEMTNNLGATTRVEYASSCSEYLADLSKGRPWQTTLPFPVQVVKKVEVIDHVSRTKLVTAYSYHHGYFAGHDRELRGFARVDQLDSEVFEDFSAPGLHGPDIPFNNASRDWFVPPVLTKTWFHTGAFPGDGSEATPLAGEYCTEDRWTSMAAEQARLLSLPGSRLHYDPDMFRSGLPPTECRDAWRALRGSVLRRETYACDGPDAQNRPYGISESSYCIRVLQPAGKAKHAVVFAHPLEQLDLQYERKVFSVLGQKLADPRTAHSLTLEVDDFGNVLKSASIGYGRRYADPALQPADQDIQARTLITYTENSFTKPIEDSDDYLAPLPCETRTWELTGYTPTGVGGRFRATDFVRSGVDTHPVHVFDDEIAHEDSPSGGRQRRRLIEHVRTYYRSNDLDGALPLYTAQSLALPFDSYKLAFTPVTVAKIYGGRATEAMFRDEGRYVRTEGDANWWIPAGQVFYSPDPDDPPERELAYARQHFFLPHRYRDPFQTREAGTESFVTYDAMDLLVRETRDALGNRNTAGTRKEDNTFDEDGNDYRVLQPRLIMDPNRNRSEVAYDALGLVVGTALMGKPAPAPAEGDSLNGFSADLTQSEMDQFLENPKGPLAATLLADATTRIVYDLTAYWCEPDPARKLPAVAATLARETHVNDPQARNSTKIQVSLSYSDGFGREIQKKIQAEPGPLDVNDLQAPVVNQRWVCSGWTIVNNKGKPVRQFEPFFSAMHNYEFGVMVGVSPVLFYDPAERVIATLHSNHTFEKVVFDPWQQTTYDVNDTCAPRNTQTGDPRTDADIGGYVAEYFKTQATTWQTWHAQRIGGAMENHERAAAQKAAAHADTPTAAHFDALGRPFLTVARNRVVCPGHDLDGTEDSFATCVDLDIEGNQRVVRDERKLPVDHLPTGAREQRIVMLYDYDMLGNRIHQLSMEAGARWMLNDVAGKPVRAWDSRGHNFTTTYDALRRPVGQTVRGTTAESDPRTLNRDVLVDRIEYGEPPPNATDAQESEAQRLNLRTRIYRHSDSAGVVTSARLDANGNPTAAYDFKGNLLHSTRRLVSDYKAIPDWSLNPQLDVQTFEDRTRYDALNRPIQSVAPHSSLGRGKFNVIQPVYNEANLLERVDVWLERAAEPAVLVDPDDEAPSPVGVADIDYNAKGQRTLIDYKTRDATVIRTTYAYDRETFRLTHLYTRRGVDPKTARGVAFTDDCENPDPPPPDTIAAPEEPPAGKSCGLQNLHYTYDPAGNLTNIHDDAQQRVFFNNQCVDPSNDYTYDALYRLIQATGREHLGQNGAPIPHSHTDEGRVGLPHPNDCNAMGAYIERYVYDAVGNFLQMQHRGSHPAHNGWTRRYTYDEASLIEARKQSNRLSSTQVGNGVAAAPEPYQHDAHGNILHMPHLGGDLPRPNMHWDHKDQLRQSDLRGGGTAWYVYDASGQRVRKVWEKAPGLIEERIYLGGCEIFRRHRGLIGANNATLERETLHVMDDKQRIALVETRTLDAAGHDQAPRQLIRYQLGNHLGSTSLELDDQAEIISYEEFTPWGSSIFQAVRSQTETAKRYRFTGKERDEESGLYYHGARYYASWLARWSSYDPIYLEGGLNLYMYANNNPIGFVDLFGEQASEINTDNLDMSMVGEGIDLSQVTELPGGGFDFHGVGGSVAGAFAQDSSEKIAGGTELQKIESNSKYDAAGSYVETQSHEGSRSTNAERATGTLNAAYIHTHATPDRRQLLYSLNEAYREAERLYGRDVAEKEYREDFKKIFREKHEDARRLQREARWETDRVFGAVLGGALLFPVVVVTGLKVGPAALGFAAKSYRSTLTLTADLQTGSAQLIRLSGGAMSMWETATSLVGFAAGAATELGELQKVTPPGIEAGLGPRFDFWAEVGTAVAIGIKAAMFAWEKQVEAEK
ncbi:MAG: SpvB/TcaC N-terminal domain-containing protein [Burkholderiales bacterium]